MRIKNITSAHGNKIANQFIIEDGNKVYFQSYNSMIVCIDYSEKTITIGEDYNYSVTTGKYRNKFFNDEGLYELANIKALEHAIKQGYIIINNHKINVVYDANL